MLTYLLMNDNVKLKKEKLYMQNLSYILNNMIPITLFNRGQAGKIFSEVKNGSLKVVIKNNEPEAIILSPKEYKSLQDRIEDLELINMSLERKNSDNGQVYTEEEVMLKYGITEEDLSGWEDIEFE